MASKSGGISVTLVGTKVVGVYVAVGNDVWVNDGWGVSLDRTVSFDKEKTGVHPVINNRIKIDKVVTLIWILIE